LPFLKKLFLSKAELDYLTANRQFTDDYIYTIKSRLIKKINQFASQELPLLVEKGYLTEFCKLTDNCKVQQGIRSSLVRIPLETDGGLLETSNVEGEEDKKRVGRKGFEPSVPAMSRRYPNQARPPARHTMKKFVAQIYVVDRLERGN
jgi:hypothetical protein